MIPLVSILNLVSALFIGGISLKLYSSYRKSQSQTIFYFFWTFFFLGMMMLVLSAPGLAFKDLIIIGIMLNIHPIFAFLSLAFFVSIPLDLMGNLKAKKWLFWIFIFIGIFFMILSFLSKESVVMYEIPPFVYWEDARGVGINIALGIIYALSILLVIVFFLIHGFKSKEKYVRTRSFLISGGLLGIVLAATFNFIFGASAQLYITSIIATIITIFAVTLVLAGIYYKGKQEVSYQPEKKDYPKIQW